MCDQWWNFAYNVNDVFKQQGLDEQGCNYVPLGLTIDEGMENRWHNVRRYPEQFQRRGRYHQLLRY